MQNGLGASLGLIGSTVILAGGLPVINLPAFNNGLFTHANITDINVQVGSDTYPIIPFDGLDFPANKYSRIYKMYEDACANDGIEPR